MKKFTISLFVSAVLFYGCKDDSPTPVDIESGLVAYYPLDNDANDASGNNQHAIIEGFSAFQQGKVGQGIKLRGDEGSLILLPEIDFNSMETFTLSIWVNEESLTSSDGSGYLFFGDHHGGYLGITHFWENIQFSVGYQLDNSANKVAVTHPFNAADANQWQLYTLVYDRGTFTAYTNAESQGTAQDEINVSNTNAAIGAHWSADGAGFYNRFIGMIDDVRIYNRALTAAEVDALAKFTVNQ